MAGLEVIVHGYGMRALEYALIDFKRKMSASGLLNEVRSRRFFRSRSLIRKQKKAIKREKSRKNGIASRRY